MTPQQLVGLSVRLFAVWLVLSSIAYFSSIPSALEASNVKGMGSIPYFLGASYLVAAGLLWFFPMLIAHTILPRTRHTDQLLFNANELARVGAALLGLWLMAKALPSIVWLLFRAFLFVEVTSSFSSLNADAKLELAISVFELALACVLILKARAFANVVVPKNDL